MLKVKNVSKRFDQIQAVNRLSFSIKKGEIVGFLGPNGAGKTTTMRLITGFLTPDEGKVTIAGLKPKQARHLIGYLPEENPLYSQMTSMEYLSFIAKMRGIEKNILQEQINQIADSCGVKEVLAQTIETISRGYRQRVGLAATLIHQPKLLVMDEPTSGLDPNQQAEIKKLIKKIAKDKAVIFSTHILSEAEAICQRVLIIHKGELVAEEKMSNLKKKKKSLEKLFHQLTQK